MSNDNEPFDTVAILGVGLLGGSLARALRQRQLVRQIVGIEQNPRHQSFLRSTKLVDVVGEQLALATRADLVLLCTPVDAIVASLPALASLCQPGTIVTDVGSTKGRIVAAGEAAFQTPVAFVGSHPLAGSEKTGPEHADENLFTDRLVVVTRTARTSPLALQRIVRFWQALGARIRVMTPEDHDAGVAVTSHLPHILSSALAGILPTELHELTATGFRDTTRLAAGNPELWTAICQQNRPAILAALEQFCSQLDEFRSALTEGNDERLRELFLEGYQVKQQLREPPPR